MAYVSIRQHTSAYVAYVSIRQHTSAYVGIRQDEGATCPNKRDACDPKPAVSNGKPPAGRMH